MIARINDKIFFCTPHNYLGILLAQNYEWANESGVVIIPDDHSYIRFISNSWYE